VVSNPAPPGLNTNNHVSASSALTTFFDDHIYPYEPIYFILGSYPAAEFQFSLKYKVLDGTCPMNPLGNLYFAYTQTSYWDLLSADPSFYDTSYKPSAFLYYADILPGSSPVHLDLQGGAEHESNGRGGSDERSLNTVYLQPTLKYDLTPNLLLTLQPRAWYYLSVGSNNKDLADYRGYVDLYSALTWQSKSWEKIQIASKLRVGDAGWHTGEQVDFMFFLPPFWGYHFNPAIDVQYFTGYGQTLRQYNVISHGLRGGLSLSF
jgi:outer membrane phospholipase A